MADLDKLLEQKQRLDARIQKERARHREAERKRDTRRKIVLASLLIADAEKTQEASRCISRLVRLASERDRDLFENWEIPSPAKVEPKEDEEGDEL